MRTKRSESLKDADFEEHISKQERSLEYVVIGSMVALVILLGSPRFNTMFSMEDHETLKAIRDVTEVHNVQVAATKK